MKIEVKVMKFCSKCGAQLPDDATFCSICGTSTTGSMPFTPVQEAPPVQVLPTMPVKPRKRLNPLVIILPVVLVLLIVAGVLYFTVFNSPQTAFIKANEMFLNNLSAMNTDELSQRIQKEDFEASMAVTVKDIGGIDDMTKQILSNVSIVYDIIKSKDQGGFNMTVNMGDAGLMQITGILTGDKVISGISSKDGIKSAAYMDLPGDKNTPPLQRLLHLLSNTKPDKRLDSLLDKVKNYALQSIDTSWFSSKQESYTDLADNSSVNATALTLTLDGKALKSFIAKFADKLQKDPDFYRDLQAYISANVPDAPATLAQDIQKGLADAQSSITDNAFKIVWTAYQAGGATAAIHINADITGSTSAANGTFEVLLQKHTKDKTNTMTIQANITPGEGNATNFTESVSVTQKTGGSDLLIDMTTKNGNDTVSMNGKGDITVTKKNANEYAQTIALDLSLNVPGASSQGTPQNIKLGVDSQYLFGNVNFQNSRLFKLADLEKAAKKTTNINDFFASTFSDLTNGNISGMFDFSKLMPSIAPSTNQ